MANAAQQKTKLLITSPTNRELCPIQNQHSSFVSDPRLHHPPFDIETIEPIEPPWQTIKEWVPDDEPDFDWFNRPRKPSNPDQHNQSRAWKPEEIPLDDVRILVLEST